MLASTRANWPDSASTAAALNASRRAVVERTTRARAAARSVVAGTALADGDGIACSGTASASSARCARWVSSSGRREGRSSGKRRTTSVVRATLRCTPATSSTASATSWVISVERTVARADGVAAGSSQPVAATPSDARPAAPRALRRVSRGRGRGDTRRSY